jgi:hypothetical protein
VVIFWPFESVSSVRPSGIFVKSWIFVLSFMVKIREEWLEMCQYHASARYQRVSKELMIYAGDISGASRSGAVALKFF